MFGSEGGATECKRRRGRAPVQSVTACDRDCGRGFARCGVGDFRAPSVDWGSRARECLSHADVRNIVCTSAKGHRGFQVRRILQDRQRLGVAYWDA